MTAAAQVPSGSCDNLLRNVEGIWSLLKRAVANFAAADPDGPVRIVTYHDGL